MVLRAHLMLSDNVTMETAAKPPDAGQPTADPRAAAKRVSHTCVTCRARKVRCDGRRNICSNCERLGFACSFDDSAGSGLEATIISSEGGPADTVVSVPRRRARQACQNCHSRKARCSGGMPQCDRCRSLGIDCVYRPGKRSRMSPVSGSTNATDGGREQLPFGRSQSESSERAEDAPSADRVLSGAGNDTYTRPIHPCPDDVLSAIAMRAFDQFFRHIHHIPTFSFLHRTSLMQRYRAGLVDRPLLLALIGITSLLTDLGPGTRDLGIQCIAEAEALVLGGLEKPTTLGLQTLVFVIHHRILSGRFSSAFMLHGVASRFASALQLNHENSRLCFLARESRRRLMWAIYIIDTSMANGATDLSLWAYHPEMIDIRLPCNERNFEFDIAEKSELLHPPIRDGVLPPLPDETGFLALHVRIRALRSRILQYSKHITANISTVDIATIPARCAELAAELDAFAARLPTSFRWSEGNVRLRTYSPRLCVFLMTHVWWEQCHCELYRIALAGLQEALPPPYVAVLDESFVRFCRRQVLEHARAMAEMFRLVLTLESGIPVTDLDLPICLYQCARLLYYIGRTDSNSAGADNPAPEGYVDLARICLRVLEQAITTPAALRIRANLEKLLVHGLSTDASTSVHSSPEIADMEIDDIASELLQPALSAGPAPSVPSLIQSIPSSGLPNHINHASISRDATTLISSEILGVLSGMPTSDPTIIPASHVDNAVGTMAATADAFRPETIPPGTLDAFDLDIDNFGGVGTELASWFSGDWPTELHL